MGVERDCPRCERVLLATFPGERLPRHKAPGGAWCPQRKTWAALATEALRRPRRPHGDGGAS